jgi:hypothetical protein
VVVLLTVWLPWVTKSLRIGPLALVTKFSGFSTGQGKLALVGGIALVAAAVIRSVEESDGWKRGAAGMAAAAGLLALVCCIHQMLRAHPTDAAEEALRVTFSLGAGLYLTMAAAVAGLAAGLLGIGTRREPVRLSLVPPAGSSVGVTAAPLPPWERTSSAGAHPPDGPTGRAS